MTQQASAPPRDDETPGKGVRGLLHRLAADPSQLEAEDLQKQAQECGATPVRRCGDRQRVAVSGVLRSVTLRPRGGVPALEAELYDGSGSVSLIWMGRRRITGIEPGRAVIAHGRISTAEGRRVIYNPDYTLQAPTD